MKSLYSCDKSVIFRETFNSMADVRRKAVNIGSTVTISKGVATYTRSANSYISYPNINTMGSTHTIRMKINSLTIEPNTYYYLYDIGLRGNEGYSIGFALIYNTINVYNGTCYVDGVATTTTITSSSKEIVIAGTTMNSNYNNPLIIGNDGGFNYSMVGGIELFEIYNKFLTATEVAELYNNDLYTMPNLKSNLVLDINYNKGVIQDSKGHTITNTAVVLKKNQNAKVISGNGTTSILTVTDANDLSFTNGSGTDLPFSLECFVKPTRSGYVDGLISKSTNVGGVYEYDMEIWQTDKIRIYCNHSNGAKYIGRTTAAITNFSKFIHVVGTYDGSKSSTGLKIYINGVQSDTTNDNALPYTGMSNTAQPVTIGWYYLNYMSSQMGFSRIYNRVLTQNEITRLYNSQKGLYNA